MGAELSENQANKGMGLGILPKLLISFLCVSMIPLIIIGYMASKNMKETGLAAVREAEDMVEKSHGLAKQTGKKAIEDAIGALDDKSTEAIEVRTETLAQNIADFLYERDQDILTLASFEPNPEGYLRAYLAANKDVTIHGKWPPEKNPTNRAKLLWQNQENKESWRHRPPSGFQKVSKPLYKEITYIDLEGREKLKIVDGKISDNFKDVSRIENTYNKAEDYYSHLSRLNKGDIHVSRVVGAYVKGWLYKTPDGIGVKPESAYAGKENPGGQRFDGIIRWATPVYDEKGKTGYLTMALDHTHLMEFTDHIVTTKQRFSDISDAGSGNYAWLWDDQDQCISHPRDFFICGYDPNTGKEVPGWLGQETYDEYKDSGLTLEDFVRKLPSFRAFSLKKKGAKEQLKSGNIALDCRILDTAPQCQGWHTGTEDGGSGSFLIFWSGLWKLTTYATVPYYTGPYAHSKRGFGYVTLGANVDDFHKAANITKAEIEKTIAEKAKDIREATQTTRALIIDNFVRNRRVTIIVAAVSALLVICASIILSLNITRPIKRLTRGAQAMRDGDLDQQIEIKSRDEIGTLTKTFNEMIVKIAEVDRMKSEFVTTASHELRTPIHAMLLSISGLLEGYSGDMDEETREDIEMVNEGLSRLQRLVEDLLNVSRIESGKTEINFVEASVASIIDRATGEVHKLVTDQSHEVIVNIPADMPPIHADVDRMTQVLINLLSNSVKYSPNGGKIIVETTVEKDTMFITVADNGYGIPLWAQEKIFEKFFQADSIMSQKVGGSGLGLSITQKIVVAHGGSIDIESPVPEGRYADLPLGGERHGTIFTVSLPLHNQQSVKKSKWEVKGGGE